MGMRHSFALILIGALSISACKKNNTETAAGSGSAPAPAPAPAPTPPPAPPPTPAPAAGGLTDPQIAAIVVAANQVDIEAGNLAVKKTKNPEVKKFAEQMVTDHTAINKAAVELVTKLKVTPAESDASKGLVSGGAETRAKLEKLDGAAFDKAYVDNEVAYHKAVIDTIDTKLVPSASNTELKNTLITVKPTIEEHLKHAEMIQQKLEGGSASGSGHKM
jgi:putative membrane protein